jgi:serine/threonine protein kinase
MELSQTKIDQARDLLCSVMGSPNSNPVELYREYIEHHTTAIVLGFNACGMAYLAKDNDVPKTFVVKKIQLTKSDQATIDALRTSLQQEIIVRIQLSRIAGFVLFHRASLIIAVLTNPKFQPLRRSRHPNILALIWLLVEMLKTQQYLVFEHATKGPLNSFLNADCKRTQLTALIRISIIYELTTAVHCLHKGGCFHRDIQSANIWLSHDYTAQLMDCRLATFVPIGSNAASTISSVVNPLSPSGAIEYMCPEYLNNTDSRHYEVAYDMYAMGVVMVELILGYLIGGPASNAFSVFRDCVQDDEGKQITNGFELLKQHADRSILLEFRVSGPSLQGRHPLFDVSFFSYFKTEHH